MPTSGIIVVRSDAYVIILQQAVDGIYLHTGGHNLWDGHYLSFDPVHDLSLELEGVVAHDGHLFANKQWDYVESKQETFWGTIGEKMPDSMPQIARVRVW